MKIIKPQKIQEENLIKVEDLEKELQEETRSEERRVGKECM